MSETKTTTVRVTIDVTYMHDRDAANPAEPGKLADALESALDNELENNPDLLLGECDGMVSATARTFAEVVDVPPTWHGNDAKATPDKVAEKDDRRVPLVYEIEEAEKRGVMCWDVLKNERYTSKTCESRYVMFVAQWGRDCDMCEQTTLIALPDNSAHLREMEASMERTAEGPWSINVLNIKEVDELLEHLRAIGSVRDRAMEAFENGKGANAFRL